MAYRQIGMFGVGAMELLVVSIMLGVFVVIPVVAIWFALRLARGGRALPCPSCGGPVVPGSNYCPHCGNRLGA
jgi:hypothetical protein